MNGKFIVKCVAVFAVSTLALAGSASAQTSGIFKVSDAIEGTNNPAGVSLARCGPGIVAGFGDREPNTTASNAGVAISKNASAFMDLGTLADPSLSFGGGDSPVIACSGFATFYYATVGSTGQGNVCFEIGCTEIEISSSTNGGTTWNPAVTASFATADIFNFLSPSLAIDPGNPKRMYIAYINHNFASPNINPNCGDEYLLEIISSSDGGTTWNGRNGGSTSPLPNIEPDSSCTTAGGQDARHTGILASPSIVVSPTGLVYATYEFVGTAGSAPAAPNEIRLTRSLNFGGSFTVPITISNHAIANAEPQIAVDRSASSNRGEIYVTWAGAPSGTYTDVLVSDSLNSGASFSFPRPISPTPAVGAGRFQTNPVIAVDFDGQVAVCFYNTPANSPASSSVYSYNCATSFNHAASWAVALVKNGVPVGNDAVITDFLLHNDGFMTTFEVQVNGTRSVVGQKFEMN